MIRQPSQTLARYQFQSFRGAPISHGVFTRLGGSSRGPFASLNVGHTVGDDPAAVEANHQAIYRVLHVEAADVVSARQVHGNRVQYVARADGGRVVPDTDALISDTPGIVLLMRFADCVPVFFYAPQQRAVGLAHAGWQGTLLGVAASAAQAMMERFGCRPEDLRVGLGPAIGPCCFEVGDAVLNPLQGMFGAQTDLLIAKRYGDGKALVDLWRANALQLETLGITQIETAQLCTCCHRGEFFSHRGEQGRTGRFAAVIGIAREA
jgi:YfiH family protein